MRNLTNKQKNILTVAGLAVGGFVAYKIYKNVKQFTTDPMSRRPIDSSPGCDIGYFTQNSIRKQADAIYEHVAGPNLLYYPEIINLITGYDDCEIDYLVQYYRQTYGSNLKSDLIAEWTGFGYYDPAINRLKQAGY